MKQNPIRQSGHALAIAMACIFILLALGVSLIGISGHVRQQASHDVANISARTAADAAVQMAYNEMQIRLTTAPWDNSALPSGSGVLPNSQENYTYNVTGDIFTGHIINATGTSGVGTSNITARFNTVGLFEYAILVREVIGLGSNSLVDSINSGPDDRVLEIAARSGLNNSVLLGFDSVVNGDVLYGATGEEDDAVKASPGSTVNGDIARMMDIWEPPFIYPPDALAALPSLGDLTSDTTITTDTKIDLIDLGVDGVITIDGDVDLYVTGDIILGNDAQIQITATNPNSSLTLYVGGNIEKKNGAAINDRCVGGQQLYSKSYGDFSL